MIKFYNLKMSIIYPDLNTLLHSVQLFTPKIYEAAQLEELRSDYNKTGTFLQYTGERHTAEPLNLCPHKLLN